MGDDTTNEDFPDQEQRAGVCYSQWRESKKGNPLKTVSKTSDELRVANYIVLWGVRDLEGYGSERVNADGTLGEYFAPDTVLESPYTKAGAVFVDWEHRQDVRPKTGEPIIESLGVVDWKTAEADERGLFVQRVLNRRSQYVRWVESLIEAGLIGTSSEPMQDGVEKAEDGKITRWPIRRDTLTVNPMEFRMMKEFGGNQLQALKALGLVNDGAEYATVDTTADTPELEASPEADTSAVDAVKARLRLELELLAMEDKWTSKS